MLGSRMEVVCQSRVVVFGRSRAALVVDLIQAGGEVMMWLGLVGVWLVGEVLLALTCPLRCGSSRLYGYSRELCVALALAAEVHVTFNHLSILHFNKHVLSNIWPHNCRF